MDPRRWLQKALDELTALAPDAEGDREDAWRAVVLVARLLGAPSGLTPAPPAEVIRQLPALVARAGSPDPDALLGQLSEALDGTDDPAGPLLDALLDIDDGLGVLSVSGGAAMARGLSGRAMALTSRAPERVRALEGFAALRGATVRPGSETALLWEAVAHPPVSSGAASATADVGPLRSRLAPSQDVIPPPRRAAPVFTIPREMLRPAAWTRAEPLALSSDDGEARAWLYEEAGRLGLEVRGPGMAPTGLLLRVVRAADSVELATQTLSVEVSGKTLYADLGPAAGPSSLLQGLIARGGLAADEIEVRVVVVND